MMDSGSVYIPSYTYPGLDVIYRVREEAKGITARRISKRLNVKEWKVKSALGILRVMGLIRSERKGGRTVYTSQGNGLTEAYAGTFFRALLRLEEAKTLDLIIKDLWPRDKRATARKRATYLLAMGRDLDLIERKDGTYTLSPVGLRLSVARALEEIYAMELGGKLGDFVSLTKILSRLSEWGMKRKTAKRAIISALEELEADLTPSPNLSSKVRRDGIMTERGYLYYLTLWNWRWR